MWYTVPYLADSIYVVTGPSFVISTAFTLSPRPQSSCSHVVHSIYGFFLPPFCTDFSNASLQCQKMEPPQHITTPHTASAHPGSLAWPACLCPTSLGTCFLRQAEYRPKAVMTLMSEAHSAGPCHSETCPHVPSQPGSYRPCFLACLPPPLPASCGEPDTATPSVHVLDFFSMTTWCVGEGRYVAERQHT